ncbi:MAG: DUF3368 domain-containing protein [Fimbriimonadaceae bacterium]|nr:DUF3368 domain-containing protein [Fimbriimonadaceae bacterium]
MPAVSDTSPLLNLAIIDQLVLLPQQFGEVWVPPAVLTELQAESTRPGSSSLREALRLNWLQERLVRQPALCHELALRLDSGEAAAIALALEQRPEVVLIDERDGRAVATALGLPVTGVLGVLLRAKRDGQITSLAPLLAALRDQARFHLAGRLYRAILEAAGEA